MRIAELARQAGVSTATLRYYEDQGLLQPARRTEAGYRIYGQDALHRVGFIQRAKTLGLSLREIQQLTEQRSQTADRQARLRHALVLELADTDRRIGELETLRGELRDQLARLGTAPTCGEVGDCDCWMPTREEVISMTTATNEAGCDATGEGNLCTQTSIDCWAKIPAIAPCDDARVTEGKKGVVRSPAA
jgi:DNA-binding transcriptional MerR regulator